MQSSKQSSSAVAETANFGDSLTQSKDTLVMRRETFINIIVGLIN